MFYETPSWGKTALGKMSRSKMRWTLPIIGLCCLILGCTTPISANDPAVEIDPVPPPQEISTPDTTPDPAAETTSETSESMLSGPGQLLPVTAQANIAGEIIDLEVAESPEQQSLGLMYRTELPDNRGMLFPFEFPRRTAFWMKNVPISLDMVFLLRGRVQAISADTPPCTTDPCPIYGPDSALVDQVIELRGGRAEELGLQPGDTVNITPVETSSEPAAEATPSNANIPSNPLPDTTPSAP
ncbi:MAG: DUF192 domain-containing protein [Cyanobacteria bacterium P01_G01_bin.38]